MKIQRHNGDFEACYNGIAQAGQRAASTKQIMAERIRQGKDADICQKGAWGNENFNYVDGKVLVAMPKYNPVLNYIHEAVEAHRKGREFYLTEDIKLGKKTASQALLEFAEQDLSKPVYERRVLDSRKKKTYNVPTKRLSEEEIPVFLARSEKLAKEYGEFLADAGISEITIYLAEQSKQAFARGFWLCWLGSDLRSGFGGNDWDFCDSGGGGSLFGVLQAAEGSAATREKSKDEVKLYTKADILKALKRANLKGIEEVLFGNLQ